MADLRAFRGSRANEFRTGEKFRACERCSKGNREANK